MFGSKKRRRARRLPVEGAAFMTLAQATVAICADQPDPVRATKYLANVLLGAMASYGLGPESGRDERAVWELVWSKFGGDDLGDGWRASAVAPERERTLELTELLAPTIMMTARDDVAGVAAQLLAPIFGKQHASQLEPTELLPCLIAGVALRTLFEDANDGPPDLADDRVAIGAWVVFVYLEVAALTDSLQELRPSGRTFRVTMTPLHLHLAQDGGPGTLHVSASGSARFDADSGGRWDLGGLALAISDYQLRGDGSLLAGFKPPMPLMMHADGDDAVRLDALLQAMGLAPEA